MSAGFNATFDAGTLTCSAYAFLPPTRPLGKQTIEYTASPLEKPVTSSDSEEPMHRCATWLAELALAWEHCIVTFQRVLRDWHDAMSRMRTSLGRLERWLDSRSAFSLERK
jgi:hypothetical protein